MAWDLGSHGARNNQRPWDESILVPMWLSYPAVFGREARPLVTPINSPDLMPTLVIRGDFAKPCATVPIHDPVTID
jgi:hypothetical protein